MSAPLGGVGAHPEGASAPWYSGVARAGAAWAVATVPPAGSEAGRAAEPDAGQAAERFERVTLLGQGGMGRVWLAFDRHLGRMVALKQARAGIEAAGLARLQHEASVTARLAHPGVVTVYDIIADAEGPIFVMAHADGQPLAAHLRAADAEARSRLLRPLWQACATLGHAHRHGVVHLDVSPNNILLGADGRVWVVDWGQAAQASAAGVGPAVGTPGFIAPERRAPGGAAWIDPRADVWSLGALLHRAVYGRALVGPEGGAPEGTVDGAEGAARVAPELAAIVRQATHSDPARRYPDAGALADDLARWLDGRRVEAWQYPTWRLAWRLVRAWRVPLATFGLALGVVVVGLAVSAQRARRSERTARAAEGEAQASAAAARAAQAAAREAAARSAQHAADARAAQAAQALEDGDVERAEAQARAALAEAPSPEARGVLALAGAAARATVVAHHQPEGCTAWLPVGPWPDGVCIAARTVTRFAGGLARWQRATALPHGGRVAPWPLTPAAALALAERSRGWVSRVDDTPQAALGDGEGLEGALAGARWTLHLRNGLDERVVHDLDTGDVLHLDPAPGVWADPLHALQLVPTTGRLRDLPERALGCAGWVESVIALPGGDTLATCGQGGALQVSADGAVRRWPFFGGEGLSTLARDDEGRLWAGTTGGRVAPLDAARPGFDLGEPVGALVPVPDSRWLVVVGRVGAVRVLDTEHLGRIVSLPGRHTAVYLDVFTPGLDGAAEAPFGATEVPVVLVAVGPEGVTRFNLPRALPRAWVAGEHGHAAVAVLADGSAAVAVDGGGAATWVPRRQDQPVQRVPALSGVAKTVDVGPDGRLWASGIRAFGLFGLHMPTGDSPLRWEKRLGPTPRAVRRLAALAGAQVAWLNYGPGVYHATVATGAVPEGVASNLALEAGLEFYDLQASPDGRCLVAAGPEGTVRWCAPPTGPIPPLAAWAPTPLGSEAARAAAVNDQGAVAVLGEGAVQVFGGRDAGAAAPGAHHTIAHPEPADDVALTAAGLVATGGLDGVVRVFDAQGALWARWTAHSARVGGLGVSADGRWLASAGWDGVVRFADLAAARAEPEGAEPASVGWDEAAREDPGNRDAFGAPEPARGVEDGGED